MSLKYAFPIREEDVEQTGGDKYAGMTLRDYFAAKAMNGILANNHPTYWGNRDGQVVPYEVAKDSYDIADAMLAQRGI